MKTKSTFTEILLIGIAIAPFLYAGIIWNKLPADVVSHYDLSGTPDDTMPKQTLVLLMAALSAVVYLVLRFLPQIDPKGQLQTSNYDKLRFVVTLTFAAIVSWMWYMGSQSADKPNTTGSLYVIVGVMLAGIGNYLTTVKPNWFVGIRTPWTLESEVVWRKTHRLGGRLMVIGGLVIALLALTMPKPYTVWMVGGTVLIVSLIPIVYSYIYFRQEKNHQLH